MPCPEKFLNVYAFGVICEINHPTFELEVGIFEMFVDTHNYIDTDFPIFLFHMLQVGKSI